MRIWKTSNRALLSLSLLNLARMAPERSLQQSKRKRMLSGVVSV